MKRPVLAAAAAVAGCLVVSTTTGRAAAAPAAPADVAVVMAVPADDLGFGQALVDSVHRLRDGGMIGTLAVAPGVAPDAAATEIATAVDGAAELVVVAGDEFDAALLAAATEHPDQHFAWIAAPDAPDFAEVSELPNVATIVPAAQQGGYVLGQLAADLVDDPAALSLLAPSSDGLDALFSAGFALGYADATGGAEVVATDEPAPGATIVAGGPFDTARAAAEAGATVLYAGFDATPFAPGFAVAMVYRLDPPLYRVLDGLAAGQFPAGVGAATVGNDGITIVVPDGSPIPAEALGAAGDTLAALRSGARDVVLEVPTRLRVGIGETLDAVADQHGLSADELVRVNDLESAEVAPGTVLETGLPTRVAAGTPESGADVRPNYVPTTAPPTTAPPATAAPTGGNGGNGGSGGGSNGGTGSGGEGSGGGTAPPAATQPPATPAPTQPPAPSVGGCQGLGVGTANQWRAEVGVGGLSGGGLGSCSWAQHLAQTGTFQHAGGVTEVIYRGQSCGGAWSGWRNSPGHYNIIINGGFSVGDFSCVVTSDGTAYAVGRLA